MRRHKLFFPAGGFLFNHPFFCRHTTGCFPPCPRALGDVKFLPFLVGTRELFCTEHHVCQDDDEHRVGDQVFRMFCLGLRVFVLVYVLQDILAIEVISLHLVL